MEKKKTQINKMGVMPVNKLLLSMAVPLMISNLVQALYNIVDSVYVSRITTDEQVFNEAGELVAAGTDAISALGLAFPIQIVIIALGMGTSIGVDSLLSRALGEGQREKANSVAMHGIVLMVFSYLFSLCLGVFFADDLIRWQGASGRVLEYGSTYLRIVCCLSLAVYMEIMFEGLLQSTGRTVFAMVPQIAGALINVVMDPILIYGLLGAPRLGVAGAAYATVFGQTVATGVGIWMNINRNPDIDLHIRNFRFSGGVIREIYAVGAPSIALQAVGSVMNFGMNSILLSLNNAAVAVFTIYYKLQSFFFMPLFGMNNAVIAIVAYNYGARNRRRMVKTHKLAMAYGFAIIFLGFLSFELIPDRLISIFDTGDQALLTIGVPALRIIGIHYLMAVFCIITGGVFQAVGNGVYSMICSLLRQLLALLPAAWIFARIGGLGMVWWCFPVAEFFSVLATGFFYLKIYRDVISKVPDGQE